MIPKITLTISVEGRTGSIEIPADATVSELTEGYIVLARLVGYHEQSILKSFKEYSE